MICRVAMSSERFTDTEVPATWPSESPVDQKTTEKTCSLCKQDFPETNFYRCLKCNEDLVVPSSECNSPVMFLCEHCVVIHLRKSHEVVDWKGYRPAFCQEHKNLVSMFCETCQLVFCFNCIGPHCKHNYKPVSEKASAVRKEIFDFLNQLDQLSKPLAARKELFTKFSKRANEHFLNSSARKITEELYRTCQDLISSNKRDWKKLIEQTLSKKKAHDNLPSISLNADVQITKLRSMLSMSDGVCVSEFLSLNAERHASIQEQKSELESVALVICCDSLENLLQSALQAVVQNFEIETIEKHPVSTYGLVLYSKRGIGTGLRRAKNKSVGLYVNGGNILNVELNKSSLLRFSTFAIVTELFDDFSPCRRRLKVSSHEFPVTSAVDAVLLNDAHIACYYKQLSKIEIFHLGSKKMTESLPMWEGLEPVFFLGYIDHLFDFLLWDNENRSIHIYHNRDNFNITCSEKPYLIAREGTTIAFVELSNKLTIVDFVSGLKIEATAEHHGLSTIDQVVLHKDAKSSAVAKVTQLSLFDYCNKKGVLCSLSVESLFSLRFRVVKIRELVFPKDAEEPITWVNLSNNALFVSTASKAFIDSLTHKNYWTT